MEVSAQQFMALEERVGKIEDLLVKLNDKLDIIETGLFGNEKLRVGGVIKSHAELQAQIDNLVEEIKELKRVNEKQDVAIQAKKSLTDNYVIWLQRGFWAMASIVAMILLVTGKIGLADLWK